MCYIAGTPSNIANNFYVTKVGPNADPNLPDRALYTAEIRQSVNINRGTTEEFSLFLRVNLLFFISKRYT